MKAVFQIYQYIKWLGICSLAALFFILPPAMLGADEAAAVKDVKTEPLVYVVPVHGEINKSQLVFLKRSLEKAKEDKAAYVVFELDTFGGAVDSALQITTLIGSLENMTSVAFVPVTPEGTGVSWSAGALIAFSCDKIFMAPGTSMGAAAPVYQGSEGMEPAPEKVVSAVRTQMAALAEKNNYPVSIATAMVDQEIEVLEVYVDGQLKALTAEEFADLKKQAAKTGMRLEAGKVISAKGKLLSLTAGDMEKYHVSSGTVGDKEQIFTSLDIAPVRYVVREVSFADQAVAFLTGGLFTSLAIIIGLVALYIELTSPGFGVPGTLAIICFAVIFLSNFLLGNLGSLEILMFLIGLVLLILELFIIPGFGVAGISGLVLIALSLILSMQNFIIPRFDWQWDIFRGNLLLVIGNIIGSLFIIIFISTFIPRLGLFKRFTLTTEQLPQAGYTVQSEDIGMKYMGRRGVALSTLRPAGKIEVEDQILDVESAGDFIEKGATVEIYEISGNKIKVRKC